MIQTDGTAPGAFIPRGSARLSIPMTILIGRDVPASQLYVYLLTADGYCGQNLPDLPSWPASAKGRTVSVTITGFQIVRLPCEVTGIRTMVHTRGNTGLLTPPTPAETLADSTMTVGYTIR